MRLNINLIALLAIATLTSPSLSAEIKTFIGVDAVEIETVLTAAGVPRTYDFTGTRVRFGIENSQGGSAGMELISGDSDETFDIPSGTLFRLETGETFGLYATLGKPVYLRVGWSIWQTEYTAIVPAGPTNKETVNALEIGLGLNLLLGRNLTLYADWAVRDTDAKYPLYVTGNGEVDYRSELLSVGLNLKF